jgi:hypothetical protein
MRAFEPEMTAGAHDIVLVSRTRAAQFKDVAETSRLGRWHVTFRRLVHLRIAIHSTRMVFDGHSPVPVGG